MKKQIVIIHGGGTFATYEDYLNFLRSYEINIERYKTDKDDWKPWVRRMLQENYEVITPHMPNKTNARYEEWKLWFEKFFPYINDGVILIGHSQGGIFLAKYLSENQFPKRIGGVMLISAPYDKDSEGYPVLSFSLPAILNLQTNNTFLYHSKDDPVVPFEALEQYQKLLPNAVARVFEDRKHINQEEFPELLKDILSLR
ncbi:alpha/beta hydrolase [Candidatus Parcubacteria bacterium]|nr:alpha/beta hydrolase [Candidatus Parcubacteria bacterium]